MIAHAGRSLASLAPVGTVINPYKLLPIANLNIMQKFFVTNNNPKTFLPWIVDKDSDPNMAGPA
jgi:hypothetical protein